MLKVAALLMEKEGISRPVEKTASVESVPKEEEKKEEISGIYDKDVGSPLVRLMFDFLTDPHSSNPAYVWGMLTAWIAFVRVLEIAFESCDGPNQYKGRQDNARYTFFFTDNQYWTLYIACMVPLIMDAVARLVMLGFVIFATENNALYHALKKDGLEMFLLFADVVGVIPFIVAAVYLRPYNIARNQLQDVVTTLIELLITGRILRLIKNMPASDSRHSNRPAQRGGAPGVADILFLHFQHHHRSVLLLRGAVLQH